MGLGEFCRFCMRELDPVMFFEVAGEADIGAVLNFPAAAIVQNEPAVITIRPLVPLQHARYVSCPLLWMWWMFRPVLILEKDTSASVEMSL